MLNIYVGSKIFTVNQIEMIERSDDKVQLVATKKDGNTVSLTGVISDSYAFEILDELVKRANLNAIVDFEKVLTGVNSARNKTISRQYAFRK